MTVPRILSGNASIGHGSTVMLLRHDGRIWKHTNYLILSYFSKTLVATLFACILHRYELNTSVLVQCAQLLSWQFTVQ